MKKEQRKRGKSGSDNYSRLDSHQRVKNKLRPPFNKIGNTHFTSWVNEVLADVLWAALIVEGLPRERALEVFRRIALALKREAKPQQPISLCHSQLSTISFERFEGIFGTACAGEDVKEVLASLLQIESLPDRAHWLRFLTNTEPGNLDRIAHAIGVCFDHQSQEATDVRWLRLMTGIAQDRIHFPSTMEDRFRQIVNYPHEGDQRQVRPSIRAAEIAFRELPFNEQKSKPYAEEFWQECWKKTGCIALNEEEGAAFLDRDEQFRQLVGVHESLVEHFINTVSTTNIDPRHDGAFGLSFYVLQFVFYAINANVGRMLPGRSLLRTVLEAYVTLAFLTAKDDPTIWLQFRNYGTGQSKLAFLKNVDSETIPSFISIEFLEGLANEDMWAEFQDIDLGAWSNKNLRQMAIDAGVKDIYDQYYDTLSAYVHGNWGAIRHAVFTQCLNPLHRFHRIPLPPRSYDEDALPDLIKFANLCLEQLNSLYPTFKPRLHRKKAETASAPPDA